MVRGRKTWSLVVALVPLLGGDLALQLLGGGVHGQSLSPAVLALVLAALGAVVAGRAPKRIAAVLLANGIGFGLGALASGVLDYASVHPLPQAAAQVALAVVWSNVVLVGAWTLFVLWFPDGAFTGRGWRRFAALSFGLATAVAVVGWVAGPADSVWGFFEGTPVPTGAAGPLAGTLPWLGDATAALLAFPLIALLSLTQRYRRGSMVTRQQVRWLLVAMAVDLVCQIVGVALAKTTGVVHDAGVGIGVASQPLPMLAATVAILRYRLWEIDLVISRALAYAVLWAGLSGLLLLPALAAGFLVGGRSALAAVGLALVVTVVFQPARARLERLAGLVVHPHRSRPRELLAHFWETLRTSGLDEIGPLLANVACAVVGAEWADVWLYANQGLRPLGGQGASAPVAPGLADRLRSSPGVLAGSPPAELAQLWPAPPAAVVSLVAGNELVGLLACGGRRGDVLHVDDFELLELLGRGSALRLRNLRLESQLRDRLVEIEAQADELRRSRQRLVAVQDEQRRRIERDLHDGVQQQLVSLAVRLRRLALERDPLLADLASEAEQAVFALQELARGIFPTVLADHGLTAALRTQAARLPLSVQVDADDDVAGRRLDPDAEAALYFVALEALTNAQKHAPDASVVVRVARDNGSFLLDVSDDGSGFAGRAREGSGLQNMADRLAAVGGVLDVDSAPGRGTRIRARVPAAQPAADSRR